MLKATVKKLALGTVCLAALGTQAFGAELKSLSIKNNFTPEPDGISEYQITIESDFGERKVIRNFSVNLGQIRQVKVGLYGNQFDVNVIEVDPFSSDYLGDFTIDPTEGNASTSLNHLSERVTIHWNVAE